MIELVARISAAVAAALVAVSATASTLTLEGQVTQGALVIGHTEPGTRVSFDGRSVRVSDRGVFLLGFGRDAEPLARLEIVYPDGTREHRELQVAPRKYDIQRIDGLPPKKVTPSEKDLARIHKEYALVKKARDLDDPRVDFLSGFVWPLKGRISGVYGSQRILNGQPRRPHYGVDIAAPVGTLVRSPADGVVTLTHDDMFFTGGTLIIDHGHGLSSTFIHLNAILVREGDRVRQGDPIAEVGATGRVTGPHLDWRMNLLGARLDPQLLVPPMAE